MLGMSHVAVYSRSKFCIARDATYACAHERLLAYVIIDSMVLLSIAFRLDVVFHLDAYDAFGWSTRKEPFRCNPVVSRAVSGHS